MTWGSVVWIGVVALALGACSRHAPPSTPTPQVDTMAAARARADSARAAQEAEARRRVEEEARARAAAEALASARAALTDPIHFDFDRSQIRDEDRANLDRKVRLLQANADLKLRVEGNADERGSDEYNLALGMRRAAAARDYMTGFNIATDRLTVVSNGEDKPLDPGHDETAWAKNRRDDFVITAGGETLKAVAER